MKQYLLRIILLLTVIFGVTETYSQNYRAEFGIMLGGANHLTDIGGKFLPRRDFVPDMRLRVTAGSAGAFYRYAITPKLTTMVAFQWGRIRGYDSLSTNPGRNARNLSFRNDILEFSVQLQYEIYEAYNVGGNTRYRIDYTLYPILGFGYFLHNPKAKFEGNIDGKSYSGWQDLRPLKTEGQASPYPVGGIAGIFGLGMDFTLDRNYKIGWSIGVRTTNTDYLDDISSNRYPDKNSFPDTDEGKLAKKLSYRGNEKEGVPEDSYALEGYPRGNPKKNDSYVFSTFNFAYVIKGKGGKYNRAFHNGYVRKKGKRISISRFFAF